MLQSEALHDDHDVRSLSVGEIQDISLANHSFQRSASSLPSIAHTASSHRAFQSRLIGDTIEKSWLKHDRSRKRKLNYAKAFPWTGFAIGLSAMALLVWDGYRTINTHKYCLVFEDDFAGSTLDVSKWSHDIQLGGFGNGQFEWTTDSSDNTFIRDNTLFLKPTLTSQILSDAQIQDDFTVDLLADGTCTSTDKFQCRVTSNATLGNIINPVRSTRIHTRGKGSIRYGRAEVQAKFPVGDWLWPAIWMLPVNDTYGPWPRSGEIDIAESRGNGYSYPAGGRNQISSGLHWGPESDMDGYYKTLGAHQLQRGNFSAGFHTFGIEWSPDYIFSYIDTKLVQVQYVQFNQYFWNGGKFPPKNVNNTAINDIWSQTGPFSTPFDQDFYLILNVAVGGTNGWFPDAEDSKPWVNAASSAPKDFYKAQKDWYTTWKADEAAMEIRNVKMWQQCD